VPLPDVTLRHWEPGDAEALNRAIAESHAHLEPWMPWAKEPPMGVPVREAWIAEMAAGDDRLYGAFLDGEIVGAGGLHRRVGPKALDIGYWVHVAHVRRGIATAMVHRLVEIAFADPAIEWVEIHHEPENVPSGEVARRAGFRPAGTDEKGHRVWRLDRQVP
jgi:RimJ/RimL family protein N-acetyltransferase